MRISVDALAMTTPMTGVPVVIAEILRALATHAPEVELDAYYLPPGLLGMPWGPRRTRSPSEICATTYGPPPKCPRCFSWWFKLGRIMAEQLFFPLLLALRRTRVLLAPAYVAPLLAPCEVWLIVHDLHVYTHPKTCSLLNRLHYRLLMPLSLRRAKRVFVFSRHVRDILVSRFPHVAKKVELLPVGIPNNMGHVSNTAEREAYRLHYGLPQKFFLFVGGMHPRKNLPRLMEAMSRLPENAALVMAGPKGADNRAAMMAQKFKWLGYVPQNAMPCLYSMARALVLPSFDEGLGLPVLEAMACHCPVLATKGPAQEFFPEALLCDPESADSIKEGLQRLWQDDTLCHELSQHAAQRTRQLSWKNTVHILLRSQP